MDRALYQVNPSRRVSTLSEIRRAEKALHCLFPDGYGDFVTTFGKGTYSDFVRVALPLEIAKEVGAFRARLKRHYFWTDKRSALPKARVVECIRIADSLNGDELLSHPDTRRLYVLPIDREVVFAVGSTFAEGLAWMCESGKLGYKQKVRYFDSGIGRKRVRFSSAGETVKESEVAKSIEALDLHQLVLKPSANHRGRRYFLPPLAGSIHIFSEGGNCKAVVDSGSASTAATRKSVWTCLHNVGLFAETKGLRKPQRQSENMVDQYFPLKAIFDSTPPPTKRTPTDVATNLLKAMNVFELGMAKWHADKLDGGKVLVPVFKKIAAQFLFRPKFDQTYSRPPQFDPSKEDVREVREVTQDQVVVVTRSQRGSVQAHEFHMKRVDGTWRIFKVLALQPPFDAERLL